MDNKIEYEFYDGAYITQVEREREIVTVFEMGGWSQDYSLTFKELLENAVNWDVRVDLNDSDEAVAKVATNIILANNAAYHNTDPFRFIPKTNKITDPRDREVVDKFQNLFDKYSVEQVIAIMKEDSKKSLKESL